MHVLYGKGGLILKPSYNAIKAEFDIGGAESGYNTYMGKKNVPKEDFFFNEEEY